MQVTLNKKEPNGTVLVVGGSLTEFQSWPRIPEMEQPIRKASLPSATSSLVGPPQAAAVSASHLQDRKNIDLHFRIVVRTTTR